MQGRNRIASDFKYSPPCFLCQDRRLMRGVQSISLLVLAAILAVVSEQLTEYALKEEHCENFGPCLNECVKKLPPNRQFTEIVREPASSSV